jgi:hypothetical protein
MRRVRILWKSGAWRHNIGDFFEVPRTIAAVGLAIFTRQPAADSLKVYILAVTLVMPAKLLSVVTR